uniref:Ovule protein n=1 Tax=Caenorhabditis tropicalis TaxID=1561998 RepID=A0A1I7U6Z2_9PELO
MDVSMVNYPKLSTFPSALLVNYDDIDHSMISGPSPTWSFLFGFSHSFVLRLQFNRNSMFLSYVEPPCYYEIRFGVAVLGSLS